MIQETRAVFPRLGERIENAVVRVQGEMVCLASFFFLLSSFFFPLSICPFISLSLSFFFSFLSSIPPDYLEPFVRAHMRVCVRAFICFRIWVCFVYRELRRERKRRGLCTDG